MATTRKPKSVASSARTIGSSRVHLDTDFLVWALSTPGAERRRLGELLASAVTIEISAIAWYEYCRGPRLPEQLAVARDALGPTGIVPFDEDIAAHAAEVFRNLGSPRKRAADIAIAVTALRREALLVSRNAKDFRGIPGLSVEGIG